jgi:hypothetical protein
MNGVEIEDTDDAAQGADGDAPCMPSPGCPWLTPCRSQLRSVRLRWSPSSTPAAPITSSPKQRHGARDCHFTSGHTSPPWSPTASGSPASGSSVMPPHRRGRPVPGRSLRLAAGRVRRRPRHAVAGRARAYCVGPGHPSHDVPPTRTPDLLDRRLCIRPDHHQRPHGERAAPRRASGLLQYHLRRAYRSATAARP